MTTVPQGLVDIMRGHTLSRKSAHVVDLITILRKNVSKGLDRKRKKLVRLVLWTTDEQNGHLEMFRCGYEYHLTAKCPKPPKENEKRRKQVRFNEKLHMTTAKIKMTNIYMHLWHACLIILYVSVEILVTVHN